MENGFNQSNSAPNPNAAKWEDIYPDENEINSKIDSELQADLQNDLDYVEDYYDSDDEKAELKERFTNWRKEGADLQRQMLMKKRENYSPYVSKLEQLAERQGQERDNVSFREIYDNFEGQTNTIRRDVENPDSEDNTERHYSYLDVYPRMQGETNQQYGDRVKKIRDLEFITDEIFPRYDDETAKEYQERVNEFYENNPRQPGEEFKQYKERLGERIIFKELLPKYEGESGKAYEERVSEISDSQILCR